MHWKQNKRKKFACFFDLNSLVQVLQSHHVQTGIHSLQHSSASKQQKTYVKLMNKTSIWQKTLGKKLICVFTDTLHSNHQQHMFKNMSLGEHISLYLKFNDCLI